MNTDRLPSIVKKLLEFRRRSRAKFILSKVVVGSGLKVIDIGCGIDGRSFEDHVPDDWEIVGVDVVSAERVRRKHPRFSFVRQDAQDLSRFRDREFDLAVSIGMLEHVTEEAAFRRIVSEIRRVATQYVVVVPYRYCWLEPHYGIPFFPVLPYSMQVALVKALNLSGERDAVARDPEFIKKHCRWLSNSQYRVAFPDSTIHLLPTLELIAITRSVAPAGVSAP